METYYALLACGHYVTETQPPNVSSGYWPGMSVLCTKPGGDGMVSVVKVLS